MKLAVFRIGFGIMMLLSVIRFWWNGWIEQLYLEPDFFFSYQYFGWVKPLGDWTYGLFILVGISALLIALGWHYRLAAITFFLGFTYVELMDKTTYLNHYYFISLLAFVMIWLPAADHFSLDARKQNNPPTPAWAITSLKIFVGVVYFYAGLAKLNSDWLIHAQPLSIWLPAKYDIPVLGELFQRAWVHYTFAWSGALYDLLIPFLLLWRPTRWLAFGLVVIFHILTRVLFPIGMFPYIMIVSATIFLDDTVHQRLVGWWKNLSRTMGLGGGAQVQAAPTAPGPRAGAWARISPLVVSLVLVFHVLFPWRHLRYPGELFWTESGYRFSWRVMLMEKAGYANFLIEDPETGHRFSVDNRKYLNGFQEKQMSTQPDFILEFAHFLSRTHQRAGHPPPAVYVESYVALNGRGSRPYVRPDLDLTTITQSTPRTEWLTEFTDKIYGL